MKKFLTIALVVAMMLTFAVGAYAADKTDVDLNETETSTGEITIQNTVNTVEDKVYSVDVKWTNTALTATTTITRTWNEETHTYTETPVTNWTKDTVTVTITNHSNAEVKAVLAAPTYAGLTFTKAQTQGTNEILANAATVALDKPNDLTLGNTHIYTIKVSGNTAAESIAVNATVTLSIPD